MNDDGSFLFFIICWWVFEVWIVYLLYKASVKLGIFEPLETLKTINPAMAFLEALVIAMVSFLFGYLGPLIIEASGIIVERKPSGRPKRNE